jgi:hypothetical protein
MNKNGDQLGFDFSADSLLECPVNKEERVGLIFIRSKNR